MSEETGKPDAPGVAIHPPIALAIALVLAVGLGAVYPLPFLPETFPRYLAGGALVLLALALIAWAGRTFRMAHTGILTSQAARTIVSSGPFAFSRNPIYVAMFIGLIGLAIALDNRWFFVAAIGMYFVIRYGVVAREEAYLARKFGAQYLDYKAKVRRWL